MLGRSYNPALLIKLFLKHRAKNAFTTLTVMVTSLAQTLDHILWNYLCRDYMQRRMVPVFYIVDLINCGVPDSRIKADFIVTCLYGAQETRQM